MLLIQAKYVSYLEKLSALLVGGNFSTDGIQALRHDIETTELLLPVIGSFSAGKSSLLNSLLGQSILPVGIVPETELATELRYADKPHILAIRKDEKIETFEVTQIDDIKSRASEFTHLKCYLNNALLKSLEPLVLVDMPGFGSSLSNHNKAISYYLPRGVFFLVLVSIEEGNLTKSMLRQLSELQSFNRDFMVLVSKANLRSEQEVQDIVGLLQEQIEENFTKNQIVTSIGMDNPKRVIELLNQIDPNKIFKSLFDDRLTNNFNSLVDSINFSKMALEKSDDFNHSSIQNLKTGLKKLENDRKDMIDNLDKQHAYGVTDRCISHIGIHLNRNLQELARLAIKGNQELFSFEVSEIVRINLSEKLQEEIKGVGRIAVDDFSNTLKSVHVGFGNGNLDTEWIDGLSSRVQGSIDKVGAVTSKLEDLIEKKGEDINKVFKVAATVLAVTTGVLAPVIELIVIFLPEIIGFVSKVGQEERVQSKIQSEIIPQIKAKLRPVILELTTEKIGILVQDISQSFEAEISEKMEMLQKLELEREQKQFDLEKAKANLKQLEESSYQLFNSTL